MGKYYLIEMTDNWKQGCHSTCEDCIGKMYNEKGECPIEQAIPITEFKRPTEIYLNLNTGQSKQEGKRWRFWATEK